MKLFLLLLSIYSLIFYQSYKKEKLKGSLIETKESLDTKKFYQHSIPARDFENAVLWTKADNTIYKNPAKKQLLLRKGGYY